MRGYKVKDETKISEGETQKERGLTKRDKKGIRVNNRHHSLEFGYGI